MKPDLIIMDMDDTLMTKDNQMSKTTHEYLLKIQREGYRIALASGRPTEGMLPTAKALEMDINKSYIMSYNGAQTIDLSTQEVVSSQLIDKQSFDEIIDFCRKNGLFALTYHDGHIVYDGSHEYMNIESELTGLPMKKVDDLKSYIQEPVPKAMGVDYEAHISELIQQLSDGFNEKVDATTSKPYFLEFMCKGVSKGAAIKNLAERLNLNTEHMIAFGDSQNDVEMFKHVGTSVAMDNASGAVKSHATMTTASNNDDGIVKALQKLMD
ncbi:HAD family hydrolase [Staphylococcus canis]|uniref:HAD family phosphatase n=1 Tax=Staphylococcus canis TaxID=2724942 RepID=A0ABS0T8Y9_9STAP|nr:HAD family hydrolase [Staphylococcus canis]MBI5975233.1 HAD family phosphatase [Staphylococcus canis]